MRRVDRPALLACLALLAGGCRQGGPLVTRQVADSAGVEVITLSDVPPTTAPAYSWSLSLRRSIPTAAPDPTQEPVLFDPRSMTRLEDGTWIVADAVQRQVGVGLQPRAVGEADRRRVLEELGRAPSSVRLSEFFPYTDIYVPFSDSVFALRHTWVSHPEGDSVPEGTFAWRLLSTGGHYLGSITFPAGFEPKWTDGELLLGVLRDSLGVATMQEYRLVPPPAVEAR